MRVTDEQLRQATVWPSESKGINIPIWDMQRPHALNAWHILRKEAEDEGRWYDEVRLSPLATRLLHWALDDEVVFADTLPKAPLFSQDDAANPDWLLERCFDGLAAVDAIAKDHDGPLHPIHRARILARYIDPKGSK